jgi:hypothetical protein
MRALISSRVVVALALAAVLAACGGSNPTAPDGGSTPVQIATGPQVLRITFQSPCPAFVEARSLPFVFTRATVTRAGAEWIATASSPASGDVELRFRESDRALGGFVPVAGTIKGTAIHLPELLPTVPLSEARVGFGSDGRTALSGIAVTVTPTTPVPSISGIGAGTVALSDGAGHSCNGTSFSWGLTPN